MLIRLAALTAFLALLAGPARAGQLTLTMADGRVTLVAENVTVRQILAEWSRVGQTKIVNGERVPGGSVTLTFENLPERQVLDTLLRAASGYVAAPRPVPVSNASVFDRILILPTAAAPPAVQAAAGRNPGPGGAFPGRTAVPLPAPVPQAEDADDGGEGDDEEDEEDDAEEDDAGEEAEDLAKPQLPPGFTARPGQMDPQMIAPQDGSVPAQMPPADRPGMVPAVPPGRISPFQPVQPQRPGMFVPAQPGQPGQAQPFVPQPGQKPDEPPPL